MPEDPYATDAELYDLIHEEQEDDVGLWQSFAGRTERPVLEVGAGTGRIAVALALAGSEVTGVDPSPAMLARARARADDAGAELTLLEGLVSDLEIPQDHFGLVLVPADVLLYCQDADAQIQLLAALAGCLHFSGTLIIDVPGPAMSLDVTTNGQPLLVYTGPGPEGETVDVWHLHEDDLASQTRLLRVTYERTADDGLVRRRQSEHALRYLYRFELEHLLRIAGLRMLDIYGDYDLGPFTSESPRMIVTAMSMRG